jgi:hypothetical protein
MSQMKMGSNDPCPCGSGVKFKKCCKDLRIDWNSILAAGPHEQVRHLSIRGKNLRFMQAVLGALQMDRLGQIDGADKYDQFKRAFTPQAVQHIYEALTFLWPNRSDLERVLAKQKQRISGLYIGYYDLLPVSRGITRHSLYSDAILLIDPFEYPSSSDPDFNALIRPENHRVNAIRATLIWFAVVPWIEAGIVQIIPRPTDFDLVLENQLIGESQKWWENHPDLNKSLDQENLDENGVFEEFYRLSFPDEQIEQQFLKANPNASATDLARLMAHIRERRKAHQYYVEPSESNRQRKRSELIRHSTGANYWMAKLIANQSGCHFITDINARWREIELNRDTANVDSGNWSPFSKAFQSVNFKFLDNVPLNFALEMRNKKRLENMRGFLRKVWRDSKAASEFSGENVANLTAELTEEIRKAEAEWDQISRDLLNWSATTTFPAAAAGIAAVVAGVGEWLPAASAIAATTTGVAGVVHSEWKRSALLNKDPAGMLLKLKRASDD